jgi:hypothetical protein
MSTPLLSCSTPNEKRDWPVNWSIPISPMKSPRNSDRKPRTSERPSSAATDTNASTVSAK